MNPAISSNRVFFNGQRGLQWHAPIKKSKNRSSESCVSEKRRNKKRWRIGQVLKCPNCPLSVAMFEANAGNFDLAKELMRDILEKPKLHTSEAMMLFTTQIQISLIQDDLEHAESSWNMMSKIAYDDDPRVTQLREMIDLHRLREMSGRGLMKNYL